MAFKKAERTDATIKLAITGPSGSGKTYSALLLAKGLGGKTAVLDTEYGSASLYSDKFEFDTWDELDPHGFPPEYFIGVIKAAEQAGYKNLIIDSISHEWNGRGGCLEIADALTRSKYRGNSFVAWSEVTPRHAKLIETIVSSKLNIIATMRAKTEYVINKSENGKATPQKVGIGSIQRDGTDYEFTTIFELDRDSHIANAGKDRTGLFVQPCVITEETGKRLADWLCSAKPMPAQPQPAQPVQRPKLDPKLYIKGYVDKVMASGMDAEALQAQFREILKMDNVPGIDDMTEAQATVLARELYKLNQSK